MPGRCGPMAALALAVLLSGCGAVPALPDLVQLYRTATDIPEPQRRPVIAVPGFLGSRLVHQPTGMLAWGADGLSLDPDDPESARILSLPISADDEPLEALIDDVRPDGIFNGGDASPFFVPIEIDVYRGLLETLVTGGYDYRLSREEELAREFNAGSFEFPYDWRRDVVEAARVLDDFIERKKQQVRAVRTERYGAAPKDVRFDIVAHSMGTLVVRYYLMYGGQDLPADGSLPELTWEGAENVDYVVLVAPPLRGSVTAFENLVNGRSFSAITPDYPAALLGSFPAMYQLMPRASEGRVVESSGRIVEELYDPDYWEARGWGLAAPEAIETLRVLMPEAASDEERRERARRHLGKLLARAEQFHRAIDRPAKPPPDLDLFLVVGGGFETPAGATVGEDGAVEIDRFAEGDGVVLRSSAIPKRFDPGHDAAEVYRSVLLLPEEHVDIVASPVFGDNLLYWLLQWRAPPEVETLQPTVAEVRSGPGAGPGYGEGSRPGPWRDAAKNRRASVVVPLK
ncbi:MAG: hypothetical protein AAF416_15140 [Pseudomonadota bacterium]